MVLVFLNYGSKKDSNAAFSDGNIVVSDLFDGDELVGSDASFDDVLSDSDYATDEEVSNINVISLDDGSGRPRSTRSVFDEAEADNFDYISDELAKSELAQRKALHEFLDGLSSEERTQFYVKVRQSISGRIEATDSNANAGDYEGYVDQLNGKAVLERAEERNELFILSE